MEILSRSGHHHQLARHERESGVVLVLQKDYLRREKRVTLRALTFLQFHNPDRRTATVNFGAKSVPRLRGLAIAHGSPLFTGDTRETKRNTLSLEDLCRCRR